MRKGQVTSNGDEMSNEHIPWETLKAHEQRLDRVDSDVREVREDTKSLAESLATVTQRNLETASLLSRILERLDDSTIGLKAVHVKAEKAYEMANDEKRTITDKFSRLKWAVALGFILFGRDIVDRVIPQSGNVATKADLSKLADYLLAQ